MGALVNESHVMGVRIVFDLLEIDGLDGTHLGANPPILYILFTLEAIN